LNFAFVVIGVIVKISLQAFGESASHSFFKNHQSLVASQMLQERLCG
jgi:hypothetical protein